MKDVASTTFTLQHDQSDCGVACLLSIIRFHGGEGSLEHLRKISGTSKQGNTLLGLMQAAQQFGIDAEGLEADGVANLIELKQPAILHVVIENKLHHYVVYYPTQAAKSLELSDAVRIGDPAKGIMPLTAPDLDKIWQSKALLKLTPNSAFEKKSAQKSKKKKWIIDLVKDDFNILFISLLIGILISVQGISTAIFSQKLIDDILPKQNAQKLWVSLALVTSLLLVRSGLGFLRGIFMVRQGTDFNNRIIQRFYGNLLVLPKSFFDTRKIGALIARMNDTRRIQTVLSVVSGSIVIDLLVVLTSLGFVFGYSPTIGFILLGVLPVYFLILLYFNKPIVNTQKEVMAGYSMAESNFIDTMQGVAEIKMMNKEPFFEKINALVYGEFQKRIVALGKLNVKFGLVSEITGVFFMTSVFGIASWMVLSKQMQLGEMVALLGIAGGVIPSITRLVVSNIQIQEALVAFDRMFEFTSMPRESMIENTDSVTIDEVAIRDVSFRFPGRNQILKNVSLQFKKGEMVALLGDSGGGKSTLMQLMQKFYLPESGSIKVNGTELQKIGTAVWRDQIAAVPQEVKIFNGNLLYNITLSDHLGDYQRAIQFCEEKGFGKYFQEFPQGYFTLLGEEGVNISGGQKQLVALTRALFRSPKLLLLDEATSAMDRNAENFILSILQKEKSKMAILIITHRVKPAYQSDRVFILENGTISTSGSPKELLTSQNFFSGSMRELP